MPTPRNSFAGTNRGHYDNPTLNDLIERYRATIREPEQGAIMRQIADEVGEEAPILLAYYNPIFGTVRSGVQALDDFAATPVAATSVPIPAPRICGTRQRETAD